MLWSCSRNSIHKVKVILSAVEKVHHPFLVGGVRRLAENRYMHTDGGSGGGLPCLPVRLLANGVPCCIFSFSVLAGQQRSICVLQCMSCRSICVLQCMSWRSICILQSMYYRSN
jgi:hypothetical protein